MKYDVIVVGAGAVGCAIARELSLHEVSVLVLEKECDAACGTSGRNSAVAHAGFNNKPGSLMAKLCVEGNQGFEALCKELDVPYNKTGKVLAAFDEEDMTTLEGLVKQGEKNGCKGLRLIGKEELEQLVPGVGGIGGMLSPNTAIYDPFKYTIALAENALANGVSFHMEEEVTGIAKLPEGGFELTTPKGSYACRYLINSAGLFSDKISAMAGVPGYELHPCRGEYYILDQIAEDVLRVPVYPAPKKGIGGLGVHLTPTIHGNVIIGPNADYIDERDDYSATPKAMEQLWNEAVQLLPSLKRKYVIGNYSGIRPKQAPKGEGGFRDFVIKEEESCPGLINLIGIESPGLTASYPIARMVKGILEQHMTLVPKKDAVRTHKFPVRFNTLSDEEKEKLIAEDPAYGEIVCRCQKVTKREIRDAIENPLGARSISAIKYRAWVTTGRCNGGYCLNRIVDMLIHEYGMKPEEVNYRGIGSEMFTGEVK